jgi:hypothetical protein
LVVEREARTRQLVGGWLEEAGMEVLVCPGPSGPDFTCIGTEAGRCPLAAGADVIVLDLWLGGDAAMRGTSALDLLHHYQTWERPVVAILDRHDDVAAWTREQPLPMLEWPPDRHELVETVRVLAAG